MGESDPKATEGTQAVDVKVSRAIRPAKAEVEDKAKATATALPTAARGPPGSHWAQHHDLLPNPGSHGELAAKKKKKNKNKTTANPHQAQHNLASTIPNLLQWNSQQPITHCGQAGQGGGRGEAEAAKVLADMASATTTDKNKNSRSISWKTDTHLTLTEKMLPLTCHLKSVTFS